jgi:hypothetical protein
VIPKTLAALIDQRRYMLRALQIASASLANSGRLLFMETTVTLFDGEISPTSRSTLARWASIPGKAMAPVKSCRWFGQ